MMVLRSAQCADLLAERAMRSLDATVTKAQVCRAVEAEVARLVKAYIKPTTTAKRHARRQLYRAYGLPCGEE